MRAMEDHIARHGTSIKQMDANIHALATDMRQRFTHTETTSAQVAKHLGAAGKLKDKSSRV